MIFRKEHQVALDNVIVLALKQGDHYENEADMVGSELAGVFRALAARRRYFAELLSAVLRRTGDLPSEPDRELVTLEELITMLRTFIASDQESEVLQEREKGEEELAGAVNEALRYDLPREAAGLLDDFRRHIARTRMRLEKLHGRS
jgi:hypothetical protein